MKLKLHTSNDIVTPDARLSEKTLGLVTGLIGPMNGRAGEYNILRTLIDNIPDEIYVKDTAGRFLICNKAVAKRFGVETPDELTGMTDFELYPHNLAVKFHTDEQRIIRTGEPLINREESDIDENGNEKWSLTTKVPLKDSFGNIVGLVGINRNITKRRLSQQKLEREVNFLHTLMNNVPDVIYCKDTKGRFVRINRACAEVLGISEPAEAIGKTDFDFYPEQETKACYAEEQNVIATGKSIINKEIKCTDKASRRLCTLNTKVPWTDNNGRIIGIIGIHRDVTELKKTQEKQAGLLTQLEASNEGLKEFAHIVSHDLKAPLRGISMLVSWLANDRSLKPGEKAGRYIKLLRSRTKQMYNLIDDILEYSQIGFTKEQKATVDTAKLVGNIVDCLAPPEGISISIEGQLPVINCDKTRLRQVFQNLLSNAIKYMDKHDGKIRIGCVEEDGFWKFSVADNGPGIDPKYAERIFKMFQTLAPKDKSSSTGLGLSIVRKIVELYGGRVWVESAPGKASTFFFTLPKN